MKRFAFFGIMAVVVGLATICSAQDAKPATPPKSLADDYIIGQWTTDGTIGNKKVKGQMRAKTGAGDTCVIFNWTTRIPGREPLRGSAIGGVDPKTKEWVEVCFESDGSHYMARYEPDNEGADVGIGYGKMAGTYLGKPLTGKITVERKGRDHFIYSVDVEGGDDWKLNHRRVKGEQAKSKKK